MAALESLGDGVQIRYVERRVEFTEMFAGDEISSAATRCSLGWWVRGRSFNPNGFATPVVMTAGHCVDKDGPQTTWSHATQGAVIGSRLSHNFSSSDWGTLDANRVADQETNQFLLPDNSQAPIRGSASRQSVP
ncbi:hypothetical protein ACFQ1L_34920 [Phytohabitans flavus]|uniref:hypothetical protein n=1 Tax=Phytohabitans flavus TaxID=1076124 RepID=UPI003644DAD3